MTTSCTFKKTGVGWDQNFQAGFHFVQLGGYMKEDASCRSWVVHGGEWWRGTIRTDQGGVILAAIAVFKGDYGRGGDVCLGQGS